MDQREAAGVERSLSEPRRGATDTTSPGPSPGRGSFALSGTAIDLLLLLQGVLGSPTHRQEQASFFPAPRLSSSWPIRGVPWPASCARLLSPSQQCSLAVSYDRNITVIAEHRCHAIERECATTSVIHNILADDRSTAASNPSVIIPFGICCISERRGQQCGQRCSG